MMLSKDDIEKIKKHESRFISLKYIDLLGNLLQIDTSSHNISSDFKAALKPIPNKSFRDPFRSAPTTTFFCENLDNPRIRQVASESIDKLNLPNTSLFSMEISFWLQDSHKLANQSDKHNFLHAVEPLDKYSNLRSDIAETLEDIDIKCTFHYHGKGAHQCIIGVIGRSVVDLADNYIISKFIIENVAENYGKSVSFTNKVHNLSVDFVIEEKNQENFIKNIKANTKNICYLLNHKNTNNSSLLCQKHENANSTIRLSIETGDTFNPYLAFGSIMLYSRIHNCDISSVFGNNILDEYKNLIN